MPAVRLFLVVPVMMIAAACSGTRQSASDFVRRGDEQVSAGRYGAAIIEYRNAVRKEPSRAEAYRKLGDAYMEEGKLEEAYHAFTNATGLNAGDVHSRVEAGRLLYGAGRFSEALVRAEQALERDDQSVDAQILAGRALTSLRRFDDAIAQLDAAVAIDHRRRRTPRSLTRSWPPAIERAPRLPCAPASWRRRSRPKLASRWQAISWPARGLLTPSRSFWERCARAPPVRWRIAPLRPFI